MEFTPFPKVPRLMREIVITEKIDGTNASVWIDKVDYVGSYVDRHGEPVAWHTFEDGTIMALRAGSRKRFVTPGKGTDNFGFAQWVKDNAANLAKLGPGVHFGEWWGAGIQRGYGKNDRYFSLFNVGRWFDSADIWRAPCLMTGRQPAPDCCHVVPILSRGLFSEADIKCAMDLLKSGGSRAAPGYDNPEGIMIYHTAANQIFKRTFEDDATGKERAA